MAKMTVAEIECRIMDNIGSLDIDGLIEVYNLLCPDQITEEDVEDEG